MEEHLPIIVVICLSVIVVIIARICILLNRKYKKFVLANSEKLKTLIILNSNTKFHESVRNEYYFRENLNSKRKLDNTSVYEFFIGLIEQNYEFFAKIEKKIKDNIKINKVYVSKYKEIKSTATEEFCHLLNTRYTKFMRYENLLFDKLILSPTIDTEIKVDLTYTSPKGRNFYRKYDVFNFNRFCRIFEETTELIKNKQSRQYKIQVERARMSDSLRYDILKKDNFRCQICGMTARDGAKLHVDHIIPVSKGGKTEISNLRTLCERCNMGKSNKME